MNEEIFYDALRDRIKLLMVRKHVTSVNDWAIKQLGMNQPTVDRMIKGQAKPSLEFLRRILALYPDVSADWAFSDESGSLPFVWVCVFVPGIFALLPLLPQDTREKANNNARIKAIILFIDSPFFRR